MITAGASHQSPRVLLVEDDTVTFKVTQLYLNKQFQGRARLTRTGTMKETLALLREEVFDAILLDLNLPDSAGLSTLRKVVNVANGTAIIVLTGSRQEELGLDAVRMGAQDFLEKGTFNGAALQKSLHFSIERAEMLSMLGQLAVQDALCGGFNRRGFQQSVPGLLSDLSSDCECFLVAFDLNGFKQVNDTHGHAAGDALLVSFAELLRKAANRNMLTARMGGDEFVALGVKGGADAAEAFLSNLGERIEATVESQELVAPIRFSAGYISCTRKDFELLSMEQLLELADARLYEEKRESKSKPTQLFSWRGGPMGGQGEVTKTLGAHLTSGAGWDWTAARALLQVCKWVDPELWKHLKVVGMLSELIAGRLGMEHDMVVCMRWCGELHDIGKLGLPAELLHSAHIFSPEEYEQVKTHTSIGAELISTLESPWGKLPQDVALYHHERWDGKGYPSQLEAEMIPLSARLVAVADVLHAMISERSYKNGMTIEQAMNEICALKGSQLDPVIVDCLYSLYEEGILVSIVSKDSHA